jgi:hypothetical protein
MSPGRHLAAAFAWVAVVGGISPSATRIDL